MRTLMSNYVFPRALYNHMKVELEDIQFYFSIGLGIKVTQESIRYILETPKSNNTRVEFMLITIILIHKSK